MTSPQKDETEGPIPDVWRPTFAALVNSLVERSPTLGEGLPDVDPVSAEVREQCLSAVESYGDVDLVPLPVDTWKTSVTAWQGDHWLCLIDLWTEQERRSDLVLEAEVRERTPGFRFRVNMVYVPQKVHGSAAVRPVGHADEGRHGFACPPGGAVGHTQ